MKTYEKNHIATIIIWIISLVALFSFIACELDPKEETERDANGPDILNVLEVTIETSTEGCFGDTGQIDQTALVSPPAEGDPQTISDQFFIQWAYGPESQRLYIKHLASFNCCLESVSSTATVEAGKITIVETENTPNPCYCMCPTIIDHTVYPVEAGSYTLTVGAHSIEIQLEAAEESCPVVEEGFCLTDCEALEYPFDGYTCQPGQYDFESCECHRAKAECQPVCKYPDTDSEGWYDSCSGELINWAICKDCSSQCQNEGSYSEGWYSICPEGVELIQYGICSECPDPNQEGVIYIGGGDSSNPIESCLDNPLNCEAVDEENFELTKFNNSCGCGCILTPKKNESTEVEAELAALCESTGGTVNEALCCGEDDGAVHFLENTCLIGACGCAPDYSHKQTKICDCGADKCFDAATGGCVRVSL